jgi:hypothetical protein
VRRLLALSALVFVACPTPMPTPDASVIVPEVDAGQMEPELDAGRMRFDAGAPDAGFTTASAATWCRTRALASCLRQVRCLSLSESSLTDCVARTADTCDQLSFTTGVDAGRLAFDGARAVTCLNDFAAGSCTVEPPSCATVFTGRVPTDGGCVTAAECSESSFCDIYSGSCPFRCRAFGQLGDGCDFFRRCAPTLGCYRADGGSETCQPLKRPGDPCVDFDECGENGACIDSQCVMRRADAGEPCAVRSGYPFCADEYFCRQDPPLVEGEPAPPGTCQRRAGLGGTCVGSGSCLPSLRCSAVITTGLCRARAKRGELCSGYADCEDGLHCSNTSQRCEPYPGDGGDCGYSGGSSGRCLTGFYCRYNAGDYGCERRRAVGEDCDYDGVCLSNECEFGRRPDGGFGGTCGIACSLKADAGL